jgi:GAF domain-containing protein
MARAEDLDHLVEAYAARLREAVRSSVAAVTLLEPTRRRLVGPASPRATESLVDSFCRHVVTESRPLVVSDARVMPELADEPVIADLEVVAYAGWPISRPMPPQPGDVPGKLRTEILGVVCAIEHETREWTSRDLLALCDLAHACAADLEAYVLIAGAA